VNRNVVVGLPLAWIAILIYSWCAQAQSLDDVHVQPRKKPSNLGAMSIPIHPGGNEDTFRVNVDLVLVPVIVTDGMNRPVTTLHQQNFAVYEGEKPQQIRYFVEEDAPAFDCRPPRHQREHEE
jgi:hypothetical protein